MSKNAQLTELLALDPVELGTIDFDEFLFKLKEKPELAETAAALIVRAVEALGEVKLDAVHPARVPYLQMMKKQGIPSYVAFDKVKGSQRTVARVMNRLRAAASGGYQLQQAMVFKGGPGCGKSFLAEQFANVLEGVVIYAVEGCPVNENPINLLKLLPENTRNQIAQQLEMCGDTHSDGHDCKHDVHDPAPRLKNKPSLHDLLATAGEPCPHCWSQVFENDETKTKPNLSKIKVVAMRLSSRKAGIATWSADDQLIEALKRGSRGVTRMPELFSVDSKMPIVGGTNANQLKDLLDATNDRRISASGGKIQIPGLAAIPTSGNACGDTAGWFPFDGVIIGETNDEGFEMFIRNTPDAQKYTRRLYAMNVPYILSVTEEEIAYREFIYNMRKQPHFDPMALKLAALLAVMSRLKKEHEVDLVTRARMYDGEVITPVKKTTPPKASAWPTSMFGGMSGTPANPKEESDGGNWTVSRFWAEAGEDEGMFGLNMADMLAGMSQVVEIALKNEQGHKCVSSFSMINFLRAYVATMLKTPGLTGKQKEVLKNCEEFLRTPTSPTAEPALLEKEYRRVLKRQFLSVVAPDFEARAQALAEKYRIHAGAFSREEKKAAEPHKTPDGRMITRHVDIDLQLLEDLEGHMGLLTLAERVGFRRSIEAEMTDEIMKRNQRSAQEGEVVIDSSFSWRTLPKLAAGITKKLNDQSAIVLERLLQPEMKLAKEDKPLRAEALERFNKLGYCDHCREVALQYCKNYELWKS